MLVTKNKGFFATVGFARSIQLPFKIQDIESCVPTRSLLLYSYSPSVQCKRINMRNNALAQPEFFFYEMQRCRRNFFTALFESKIFLSVSLAEYITKSMHMCRIYIFHMLKFLYVEIFYVGKFYFIS